MKTILKQLFTEPDNQTFCPVRLLAFLGSVEYLGVTLAHYLQHAAFDPQGFALGFGGMVGGVGAALKLKKDTPTS